MFINKDLLDFFSSMAEIKKQKRDVFYTLAAEVDDADVKKRLLQIGKNEQLHVDQLQQSMDLVNGAPYQNFVPDILTETPLVPFQIPLEDVLVDVDDSASTESAAHAELPHHDFDDVVPFLRAVEPEPDESEDTTIGMAATHLETSLPDSVNTGITPLDTINLNIDQEEQITQISSLSHFKPTASQNSFSMDYLNHPLAEVFGFTTSDLSSKAQRYRSHHHCPFNNRVPNCTNENPKNPLGVCSLLHNNKAVITCPVRFREEWLITDDAASFFFPEGVRWSSLTEVELTDAYGKSSGSLDLVLVAYDDSGKITDFGAIEIQSAFITGDARDPFNFYMKDPKTNSLMDWSAQSNFPQPDYVSAMRESLVPQLIFKGSILNSWSKKLAISIDRSYFEALPNLVPVEKQDAEIAWFIYDLELVVNGEKESYELKRANVVYTKFQQTLSALSISHPDNIEHFMKLLP
ncbi:MAG: NotI family restriction endonuclease [Chlorobium sp.]